MHASTELRKLLSRLRRPGVEQLIKEAEPGARVWLSNAPELRGRLYHLAIDNPALQARIQEIINGQKT